MHTSRWVVDGVKGSGVCARVCVHSLGQVLQSLSTDNPPSDEIFLF